LNSTPLCRDRRPPDTDEHRSSHAKIATFAQHLRKKTRADAIAHRIPQIVGVISDSVSGFKGVSSREH
jgi:hemerythrin superfamily protein